jgi:AmiR/NasT family two-component response regulator
VANQFDGVEARALPAQIAAEMERLVVYADAQERKVSELQAALDSRVIIEQALGILAERFELPFAEAFEVLRAAARNSRREVRAVAEELRASRETPPAISDVLPADPDPLLSSELVTAEDLRCPRCGTLVSSRV